MFTGLTGRWKNRGQKMSRYYRKSGKRKEPKLTPGIVCWDPLAASSTTTVSSCCCCLTKSDIEATGLTLTTESMRCHLKKPEQFSSYKTINKKQLPRNTTQHTHHLPSCEIFSSSCTAASRFQTCLPPFIIHPLPSTTLYSKGQENVYGQELFNI